MEDISKWSWEDYEDCYLNVEKTEIEQLRKELGNDIDRANYARFRRSAYWKAVTALVLERDHHRCTRCGYSKELCVHHLNYFHFTYEHAHLADLTTLCGYCHKSVHGLNK